MYYVNCELFYDAPELGAFLHVYGDTEDSPHELLGLRVEPLRIVKDAASSGPEEAIVQMIQFLARSYHATRAAEELPFEVLPVEDRGAGVGLRPDGTASRGESDEQ